MLIDRHGHPIAGQYMTVARPDFYGTEQTFKALDSGTLLESDYGYKFQRIQTGRSGEFHSQLPGESRYIGFMAPLMSPSEETLKSFILGIRTSSGVVVAILVSGGTAEVKVPLGPKPEFVESPDNYPVRVSANVSRTKSLDVLQIVIQVQDEGV